MRYVIAILIVCAIAASALQATSMDSIAGKPDLWTTSAPASNMEKKLMGALEKLSAVSPAGTSAADAASNGDLLIDSSLYNSSDLNSSALNSSLNLSATNTSAANSSMINASVGLAGGSSYLQTELKLDTNDSQKLGSRSQGGMKGFYGYEASQKGFGKSGINSHMYLSGDFAIDNNVKFQDRNF
jgi:hypothetical protein